MSEQFLYVAGSSGVVYCFALESHELIDMWVYDKAIVAMDCALIGVAGGGETGTAAGLLALPLIALAFEDGEILIRRHSFINGVGRNGGKGGR